MPRGLAILATRGAEKQVAQIRRAREVREIRDLGQAREVAAIARRAAGAPLGARRQRRPAVRFRHVG